MGTRVWDQFLTEQDKASLGARKQQVWGYGERPVLLMIDLFRWVFGDRRRPLLEAMKEWPGTCGEAGWDALPHIVRLLTAARAAKIPVVHVTGLNPLESGVTWWTDTGDGETVIFNNGPIDPEKQRSRYDIIAEVAPIAGEAVLRKCASSGFYGTPLAAHLNTLRADALLVCGESTSGCVRATVVDGRTLRYRITVVEECVFDRHQAPHAINLFDMHQKYADVLGIDQVVAHLESVPAARGGRPRKVLQP